MKLGFSVILCFLLIAVDGRGLSVDDSFSNGFISLYKDSQVVDLFDNNTNLLYNSETLWVVQFYSHWCGHCQRFAPFYKELAESISAWSPIVKFAAMNCADQSCDKYQVQGTPTIRIFHPRTAPNSLDSTYFGFNLPVKSDEEYFLDILLYNLALVTGKGVNLPVNLNTISEVPSPDKEDLSQIFTTQPETVEYAAFIFEQEGKHSVGKKILLDMNKLSDVVPVFRVNFHDPSSRQWKLLANPSMAIIDRDGNILEQVDGWGMDADRRRFTNILKSYAEGNEGKTSIPESRVTFPSTTMYTVPDKVYPAVKDEVFMSDLEKAVEYSLMNEVAMQPVLDQMKLQALVYYIETLLNFFPNMRPPLKSFLISLREWPVQMRYAAISHTDYKFKVNELSQFYQPFAATPLDWEGCAGSHSRFRGYPCSLWSLFHTLIVSASDKDPAFHYGGVSTVANSMIGYVSNFFSCRECADHFSSHVSQLGYLPHTGDQSILWLWTIHNTANLMLAGDQTEDPTRPKIQWPNAQNCPACRTNGNRWMPMLKVNAELWNQSEVLAYIKNIYSKENLTQNVKNMTPNDQIQKILNELKEKTDLENSPDFERAHDNIMDFCRK